MSLSLPSCKRHCFPLSCKCLAQELGSGTPADIERLARCGGRGTVKSHMWRDVSAQEPGVDAQLHVQYEVDR